jgi:hypothetical protein
VHNFGENSISDILCVSIPEEDDEDESKSKSDAVNIAKMHEEIRKLK